MDAAPVLPPTRPLFRNIHHRQIQHFQQTVVCRENALGLCDLPQLPIKAFDRVRGIDQTADFLRIFEVGAEVGPVFPPRLCDLGIFIVPVLRESLQGVQSSLLVHCCIHGFQIGHESLQVFVRNVFAGIPQLVNHAVLNLRFREHCMDGCIETSQIVCTCDKNILYAPIPQTIQYGRPELCALILADPHAQNIFATIQIKADGNVHCFLYDLPFAADMVVDRIQKNYGIDRFQRPLLPFLRHRQDLIRDPAYRSVRHSQPVDILNMRLNVTGRHAFRIHGQDLLFDILTDAGLVLFQKLRFKLPFSVTGNRNLDIAETGPQIFAAVAVPTVVCSFVLVVVFAVTKILIQFSLQTILHKFGNGFLEQVLDVVHEWFSDDLKKLDDDKVFAKLQGHWIIEMSEMLATSNAKSIEEIRSFISRQKETYRTPYETQPKDRLRQCVFGGSSNTLDFLPLDRAGNRRFLPVMIYPEKAEVHILEDEAASREYLLQVWAEAMTIYRSGEYSMKFSKEIQKQLVEVQKDFMPEDTEAGQIQGFLEHYTGNVVCSKQLFKEALGHAFEEPKRWQLHNINEIMNTVVTGWKPFSNPRMFAGYGRQRGWEREISGNELPDNEGGFVELSEEEVRQLELPKEWIA